MEAGSSQTTTTACWAAWVNRSTLSDSPAAVSITSTSGGQARSPNARMISPWAAGARSVMALSPEAAGTIDRPRGPRTMLLDADLGLANVDVLFGLQPRYNLQHVISGETDLESTIVRGNEASAT